MNHNYICGNEIALNKYLDELAKLDEHDEEREAAELEQKIIETMDSDEDDDRDLCATMLAEAEDFVYLVHCVTRIDPNNPKATEQYARAAKAMAERVKEQLKEYLDEA